MPEANIPSHYRPSRRQLLLLAVCVLGLYVVVPQFGDFRASWHLLRHPDGLLTLAAICLTLSTYGAAAGTYCFLARRKLAFGRTLLVQLAAMFMNRLLPVGAGSLGINYLYLRHQRHRAAEAASMVAVNNLLGFVGNALLLLVGLLLAPAHLSDVIKPQAPSHALQIGGLIVVLIIVVALIWGGKKLRRLLTDIFHQLLEYRRRPYTLLGALGSSMLLTLCNVLCFLCCLLALGIHLPFVTVLLILSLGVGAGTVTPTPGGLGGFEAALAAGLVAYGVDQAPALAAAILYRLISYWLPLLLGAAAFTLSQRQNWFAKPRHAEKQG